jgi:acetyl-CoA carboxylase biotin carboxyl carrier protein
MNKGGRPKDVFDVERIRQIIELMEEHDLAEIDLQEGDEKMRLTRLRHGPLHAHAPLSVAPPAVPAAVAPAAVASAAAVTAAGSEPAGTITIKSPMVGTFFSRANPESEPYVRVGDRVSEETIVCIVEAMKVFNEIPAECRGKIVEVLVNDQEPVDFGKPMFRVQPTL